MSSGRSAQRTFEALVGFEARLAAEGAGPRAAFAHEAGRDHADALAGLTVEPGGGEAV